nr:hypothetical protein [Tanacetum cinerariifolium]
MSDSEDSTVNYTEISSPFEDLLDIGSPRVDGLPMMPQDPYAYVEAALQASPSPDYVPGPKHPLTPKFVPRPIYPEFMPPEDDVLPAKEQPLPAAISPTADSLRYILEFGPEEDDEYPEEDAADYPTDRDDDDEDKEEESFKDKAYDEKDDEDEEEEEHPALADSVPTRVHRIMARMFVRDHTPISHPLETEVARLLVIPTPPPSLLSLFSSPLPPNYHHYQLRAESPSTSHLPPPIVLPDTKASIPMLRVAAPSTYILAPRSETPPSGSPLLLPIPLPVSSPTLLLPSTSHREDEATDMAGLSQRMTDFVTTVKQDIDEIYVRLDNA